MKCKTLHFSRHAFERMFQRGINPDTAARIVEEAEIIIEYPDDKPYPSALLLGFYRKQAIHTVVAQTDAGDCQLATIYWPDPAIWDESFKRSRQLFFLSGKKQFEHDLFCALIYVLNSLRRKIVASLYLSRLKQEDRLTLISKLHATQHGNCFICEQPIDLAVHKAR